MDGLALIPVFLVGLLGSLHCVGMCGGIVGAFSTAVGRGRRVIPLVVATPSHPASTAVLASSAVFASTASLEPTESLASFEFPTSTAPPASLPSPVTSASSAKSAESAESAKSAESTKSESQAPGIAGRALRVGAYNVGRIASYATAGALAGGLAGGVRSLADLAVWQSAAYWLANLVLVALGLHLMGAWHGLSRVEQIGATLWRLLQPLTRHLLPLDSAPKMLLLGALWGWLPCGMVYSVLLTAAMAGSAPGGAAVMLAFGMGTLPALMALGLLGTHLRMALQGRRLRLAGGMLVLAFGLLGLARATNGSPPGWLDALCISPAGGHPWK